MKILAITPSILLTTSLNAGIWHWFDKMKRGGVRQTSVVGVRGSNVSKQEVSSLVKAEDLYWAE